MVYCPYLMRRAPVSWIVLVASLGVALSALAACAWHLYATAPCGAYINPLNTCHDSEEGRELARGLRSEVEAYIEEAKAAGKANAVTVYFQSLTENSWFSVRNDLLYFPASTAKLSLLMWFMAQGEAEPELMEKKAVYTWDDRNASQYFKYDGIRASTTYAVSELMESMIVNSDNNATYLLELMLEEGDLMRIVSDFNFHPPAGSSTAYRVDAKTLASEFRILYNSSYLTPQNSQKALELLTRTKFDRGLRAGVPNEVPVAHKFGERKTQNTGEQQVHDCGIVYEPGRHYVLCVMTQGRDPDTLASVIADISKITYEAVSAR